MRRWILRAASHPSHMAVANLAASLRRIRRTKRTKDDKCGKKDDKLHILESKSGNKAASQEQVLESLRCSKCIAESTSGDSHHKKLKKHGKKKSHKSHKKMHQ